jgi:hypothetical protein
VIATEGVGVAGASGVADGGRLAVVSLGSGVALAGGWLAGGWLAGGAEAGGVLGIEDGLAAGVPDGVGDPEAATMADAAGVVVGAWDAGALGSGWRATTATEPGSDGSERLTTIRRVPSLEPKTVWGSVANLTGCSSIGAVASHPLDLSGQTSWTFASRSV